MIYKLYIDRAKDANPTDPERVNEFKSIYAENEVEVVGVWQNTDNPKEFYFMTGYRDDDHYNSFIEKMKTHDRYQELSQKMAKERESIEAVNLRDAYPG